MTITCNSLIFIISIRFFIFDHSIDLWSWCLKYYDDASWLWRHHVWVQYIDPAQSSSYSKSTTLFCVLLCDFKYCSITYIQSILINMYVFFFIRINIIVLFLFTYSIQIEDSFFLVWISLEFYFLYFIIVIIINVYI